MSVHEEFDTVELLPVLGPHRDGYPYDPTVVVWSSRHQTGVFCSPGSAVVLFTMMTGRDPAECAR